MMTKKNTEKDNPSIKLNVYDVICQLVDEPNSPFRETNIGNLLPINSVYKDYPRHQGKSIFKIDFPKEYGKSFEIEINVDDNGERVNGFEKYNIAVRKYNNWVTEKNEIHNKEVSSKLPPDGKVYEAKRELGVKAKHYFEHGEINPWEFILAKPLKDMRGNRVQPVMKSIKQKELYLLKEQLSEIKFAKQFNKTIFDYIQKKVKAAKETNSWDSDNIWYQPNKEFAHWFDINGYNHNDILPIVSHETDEKENQSKAKIGRPRGKSQITKQRHNWIRDKYEILRNKRSGSTLKEFADLIYSELQEKTPHFFSKPYEKSQILKVLKQKSWSEE